MAPPRGGNDRVRILPIGLWIICVVWTFWEWLITLNEKNGEKFSEIYAVYVCYHMIYRFLLMYHVIEHLYYSYISEAGIKYHVNYPLNPSRHVYPSIKSVYDCAIFCTLRMTSPTFSHIVPKCSFVVVKIKTCMCIELFMIF